MNKDELLDLVNEKDEVIGEVWKSEAHKDPTKFHREVAIVIFSKNNEVLLQQRSFKKSHDPGQWKLTAAGHVGRGETPKVAAERELEEELGLKISPKYFGKKFVAYKNEEARFFWIYYSVIKTKPRLILDSDEVAHAKWVKIDKLDEFAKENDYSLTSNSHKILVDIANKLGLS